MIGRFVLMINKKHLRYVHGHALAVRVHCYIPGLISQCSTKWYMSAFGAAHWTSTL